MKWLLGVAIAITLITIPLGIGSIAMLGKTQQSDYKMSSTNLEAKVNAVRVGKGLEPLVHDDNLCKSAHLKAVDMADGEYFAHVSPNGTTPFDVISAFSPNYKSAGENLALSNIGEDHVIDGWVKSEGHYINMVGNFTLTCIQTIEAKDFEYKGTRYKQTTLVVQHFVLD